MNNPYSVQSPSGAPIPACPCCPDGGDAWEETRFGDPGLRWECYRCGHEWGGQEVDDD